jgi:hypothetical protein
MMVLRGLRQSTAICAVLAGVASSWAQAPQATLDDATGGPSASYLNQVLRTSNQAVGLDQGQPQPGFTPPRPDPSPNPAGQGHRTVADTNGKPPINTGAAAGRVIDMKLTDETFADLRNSVPQDQPGVKRIDYQHGEVIPVALRQNAPVDIVLPEWEVVEDPRDISLPVPWMTAELTAPNALRIATKQIGYDGPLKVTGRSGNLYVFWVTVTGIRAAQLAGLKGAQGLGAEGKALPDLMVIVAAPDPTPPAPVARGRRSSPVRNAGVQVLPPPPTPPAPAKPKEIDYAGMVNEGLSPPLRGLISDAAAIRVPHRILEKHPGDALAIGPIQVVEAEGFTFIDFGDDGQRPRPAISLVLDGIDSASANPMTHPNYPTVVVIDKIGSFTLTFEDRIVCILRTADEYGGLKEAKR